MENKKKVKRNSIASVPLFAPTQAKGSGLALSLNLFVSLAFSLIVLFAFGLPNEENGYENKDWYLYLSYILPQLSTFVIAIGYFIWLKKDIKQTVRAQKCHPKYFLWALLLQIGMFSLAEANGYFMLFLEKAFGYVAPEPPIPSLNGFGLFGVIFVIGVLPAIFEELFFRGIILKGLRSFGTVGAILLCGGLFSLYHQNPAQTIYQFLCGLAFSLIAVRAGSILPTVLAHFVNNTVIILLEKFGVNEFPLPVYITVICVAALCLVGSLVYLIGFDKSKWKEQEKTFSPQENRAERLRFFVCASVGIFYCAFTWVLGLLG